MRKFGFHLLTQALFQLLHASHDTVSITVVFKERYYGLLLQRLQKVGIPEHSRSSHAIAEHKLHAALCQCHEQHHTRIVLGVSYSPVVEQVNSKTMNLSSSAASSLLWRQSQDVGQHHHCRFN